MKKLTPARAISLMVLLIFIGFTVTGISSLLMPVPVPKEGAVYYLKPGASKSSVVQELAAQGIIRHPLFFSLYGSMHAFARLKTGEYWFQSGSTPLGIWKQMTTGTGLYYRSFTLVPGWTFAQLKHLMTQSPYLKLFADTMNDQQIMALLGAPAILPEGQFMPETYYYTRNEVDITLFKRSYDLMQSHLKEAWDKRAAGLPYKNPYEALIAASLVEKEAYLSAERPVIAGVLVNRLKKNMLLQFDPTVIYGMGDRYQGTITKADLRENTPYNTYVHKGLPPTPIAMPSEGAIEAVMHPVQHDYLYFVARGDGSHQFSKTLSEHNAAVQAAIKYKKNLQSLLTGKFQEYYARQID